MKMISKWPCETREMPTPPLTPRTEGGGALSSQAKVTQEKNQRPGGKRADSGIAEANRRNGYGEQRQVLLKRQQRLSTEFSEWWRQS